MVASSTSFLDMSFLDMVHLVGKMLLRLTLQGTHGQVPERSRHSWLPVREPKA